MDPRGFSKGKVLSIKLNDLQKKSKNNKQKFTKTKKVFIDNV